MTFLKETDAEGYTLTVNYFQPYYVVTVTAPNNLKKASLQFAAEYTPNFQMHSVDRDMALDYGNHLLNQLKKQEETMSKNREDDEYDYSDNANYYNSDYMGDDLSEENEFESLVPSFEDVLEQADLDRDSMTIGEHEVARKVYDAIFGGLASDDATDEDF